MPILRQEIYADGSLHVEVIATKEPATCPHCQVRSTKQHDVRLRRKRDVPLRGHDVILVLHTRRFWCRHCHKAFTESDEACGRRKRTTVRLREGIGTQACSRPLAHVARHYHVSPRFVQGCLDTVASRQMATRGLSVDEQGKVPTPRFLGSDEFARRKEHRYDTILCDLDARQVLEVRAGHTQEEVSRLLDRLSAPEEVQAVSMDMSRAFREAVQLCLPRARIVADHFHVIQHVGKAVKKVVSRSAKSAAGKKAFDGHRHLFFRTQHALSEEQGQTRDRLALAFPEIAQAWQLKEALRTWYATATAADAATGLDEWMARVRSEGPAG